MNSALYFSPRGFLFLALAASAAGATYHVSATSGDDRNAGTSPAAPWRTLGRVNAADLQPGDTVRFQRGETWRGQLVPRSGAEGAPVTYADYGTGAKPRLLGSVSRNRSADWQPVGEHRWTTVALAFTDLPPLHAFPAGAWHLHREGGAQVTESTDRANGDVTLTCTAGGAAPNHIQLFQGGLRVRAGELYTFTFRVRATQTFEIPAVTLTKQSAPYTVFAVAEAGNRRVTPEWTERRMRFRATATADDARVAFMLGGALPAGATFTLQPVSWQRQRAANDADELNVDVGNLIFDEGKTVGAKRWRPEDVRQPGDYWYNAETRQVLLGSVRHPAEEHSSIELALRRHVVDETNRHHVTYENLAVLYGAAHGFGGASTHHLIIRNCDIGWIGGGHQTNTPDGRPVRYGNGIEFWSDAHDNLVEACRLWEIYDAALTNQGDDHNTAADITYRDNVIWRCEFSFEFWNGKKSGRGGEQRSVTRRIRFEHNTCVDAGYGWGHTQRPDPNGRHLMFYHNAAATSDVVIRDNLFVRATDSGLRLVNDWTAALTLDHNLWYQPQGVLMLMIKTPWTAAQFGEFQKQTKLDAHSIVADPRFVAAEALDFRLRPDSPALTRASDGGPAGARQRLVE